MSLRKNFEQAVESAAEKIRGLNWESKEFYSNWLAQQYFLVQHTPRLLCAFALQVPLQNRGDFDLAMNHLKEEAGHDLWLLNDLKQLGLTPNDFKPLSSTSALIQSQYYQIQHLQSVSLFGYSQFLEYLSAVVAGEIADRVEKCFGKKAAVFLRGHAQVDVGHADDGWKMLEVIPPEFHGCIIENMQMTQDLYFQTLVSLESRHQAIAA